MVHTTVFLFVIVILFVHDTHSAVSVNLTIDGKHHAWHVPTNHKLTYTYSNHFITKFKQPVSGAPNRCEIMLDAALLAQDGYVYMFSGKYVWKIRKNREVERGFPQLITTVWGKQAPVDLNAAFASNHKIYLIKGTKYWRYSGRILNRGYPKHLRNVKSQSLDAAFFQEDGGVYFIKDGLFYRHRLRTINVESDPHKLSAVWKGLPSEMDAALHTTSGLLYFFKDNQYYRVRAENNEVDRGYPKSLHHHWLGCDKSKVHGETIANQENGNKPTNNRIIPKPANHESINHNNSQKTKTEAFLPSAAIPVKSSGFILALVVFLMIIYN